MLSNNVKKSCLSVLVMATAVAYAPVSNAVLEPYTQNFDALDASDTLVLGVTPGDGWSIFADVWDGDVGTGTYLYGYGPFPAPNNTTGFSSIEAGEGQGDALSDQYLNIFSDYLNADHAKGFTINTSVFQERILEAADIGSGTWVFTGHFKSPATGGIAEAASDASATIFIKTLDPNDNYATTNLVTSEVTDASNAEWNSFTISIDLSDPLLAGQILQFGFNTVASNYDASGVYYDNLCFSNDGSCDVPVSTTPDAPAASSSSGAVSIPGSVLLALIGLARLRRYKN